MVMLIDGETVARYSIEAPLAVALVRSCEIRPIGSVLFLWSRVSQCRKEYASLIRSFVPHGHADRVSLAPRVVRQVAVRTDANRQWMA